MALEMRDRCERCGEAYIRSYQCSCCRACYDALQAACANCGGELVRRPQRTGAG